MSPQNDRASQEDDPLVLVGDHDSAEKFRILVLTIVIFGCFVGVIFGASHFAGILKNEFQHDVMVYVVIPLLFASIICILPAMMMQGKITTDFLRNMSDGNDAAKRAVQSSAGNISLVCALIATIAIPLMYVDPPGNEDLDRIFWFYWYYGLASIAASCSFAGTIMGVLVLMYTDPLSNDSVLVFIKRFPGVIGLPFALLLGSCIFIMAAFVAYTMYVMDILFFFCHAAEVFAVIFCIGLFQYYCGIYQNKIDSLISQETRLLGYENANDITTSEYLRSLDSEQLVTLMKKEDSADFILSAADAFEAQGISGTMLSELTYEIVTDILKRNNKKDAEVKIGDVINVCSKLGIDINK